MTTFTDLQTCDGFLDFQFLHILSHMIESVDLCHITFHQLLISYDNNGMILLSIITTEYGLEETIVIICPLISVHFIDILFLVS